MAGTGFQSNATFLARMCAAECHGFRPTARFEAFRGQFKSIASRSVAFPGQILPRSWHSAVPRRMVVGIPQYVCERNATGLKRPRGLWHSTENLSAELSKRLNSSTCHFHRQVSCLLRYKFLMPDSPGARYICGGLFRPKLYTNGLSWHTITWYYPFINFTLNCGFLKCYLL
jgi:hypothetical protein